MAILWRFFMTEEDESAFLRHLGPLHLEVYPERIPEDWTPFVADDTTQAQLPEERLYLVASEVGPALVDRVKRGPDKGTLRIDEVRSPVLHLERSVLDEEGRLLSGRLWSDPLVALEGPGRSPRGNRGARPVDLEGRFRRLLDEVDAVFKKRYHHSQPKGFWVGAHAARSFKQGLALIESGRNGGAVRPYR